MTRTDEYAKRPVEDTLKSFGVDVKSGLSEAGVVESRTKYGYNETSEKVEPLWHRVLRRFWVLKLHYQHHYQ